MMLLCSYFRTKLRSLRVQRMGDRGVQIFFLRVKAKTELEHDLSIRALVRKLGLHFRQRLGIEVIILDNVWE